MSLKTVVCSAVAASLGLPVTGEAERGRHLVEHGLGPRFVKGKPQAYDNIQLANQTAASMMRSPSRRVHLDVSNLAETELTSASFAKLKAVRAKIAKLAPHLSPMLEPRHSFIEALAALYALARGFPDFLEQCMFNTSIEIDHLRSDGAIYLEIEDPQRPGDLIFCDTLEYAAPKPMHIGHLSVVSRLPARAIIPVAVAVDKESS